MSRQRQKNRFEPRPQPTEQGDIWNPQLSLEDKVGIYARQSTQAQVIKNVQSAEMQTIDLIEAAKRLGWTENQIILYVENRREDGTIKNASGTLRIDQRPGLQALCERIDQDEIKAVIVAQVDRLFRDETMLAPDTFIDKCKRHNCLVITFVPDMVFDFRNPMHVKMFRFLAETAAEYITHHIKGRLIPAKERLARKGCYAGYGSVPMGFIVDRREKIMVDGREESNPTYRKYIVYEPHAKIIRWLFRRFRELGGNMGALCRELETMPYIFPDFPDKSYETLRRLKRVPGGFHLTRRGLLMLLTNPVYIGWWVFMGVTYSKANHTAIVEQDDFWYAFIHLSDFTPEGEKNEREKRVTRYVRRATEDTNALLKDVIGGSEGSVYAHKHAYNPDEYLIVPATGTTTARGRYHISAADIDTPFRERLFEHLRMTHTFDKYREYAETKRVEEAGEIVTITDQLQQIDRTQETIIDDRLHLRQERLKIDPANEEESPLELRLKGRFNTLEESKKQLKAKLAQLQKPAEDTSGLKLLADFHTELEKLIPVWDKATMKDRRGLINALVNRAVLDYISPRWVRLVIEWVHPEWGTDLFYIYRAWSTRTPWTEEELTILREYYPAGDRNDMLHLLPTRSLEVIRDHANKLGLFRSVVGMEQLNIPKYLSMADWQFMQKQGIREAQTVITKVDKPPSGNTGCSDPQPCLLRGQYRCSASVGCCCQPGRTDLAAQLLRYLLATYHATPLSCFCWRQGMPFFLPPCSCPPFTLHNITIRIESDVVGAAAGCDGDLAIGVHR